MNLFEKRLWPYDIIRQAVDEHQPSHVFGLFSGGHDSLCACHLASRHDEFRGVIHINTGIGVEETRQFVRDVSKQFGWPFHEYHPPESYESLVVEHGFPGPAQHGTMYRRLKERCMRQVLRDFSGTIGLISGARSQESKRRMGTADAIRRGPDPSKRALWINPIISWDAHDKRRYMAENNLPANPVVERLCMSGECLCGAFAEPGELDVIRGFYPEAAAEIDRISAKVKAAGQHCVWGTRPEASRQEQPHPDQLPLCFSCKAKHELEQQ